MACNLLCSILRLVCKTADTVTQTGKIESVTLFSKKILFRGYKDINY